MTTDADFTGVHYSMLNISETIQDRHSVTIYH